MKQNILLGETEYITRSHPHEDSGVDDVGSRFFIRFSSFLKAELSLIPLALINLRNHLCLPTSLAEIAFLPCNNSVTN